MGSKFSETTTCNNAAIFDQDNQEQLYAFDMIAKTNTSFFLTGRAGTGKTTFLQNVQGCVDKSFIVLAPSGVAAIQAGGQTIHSFFGFDFSVQGPLSFGRMNENKIALVENIDTIIIDEVSMVRCDVMDAIDRMLRHYRKSSQPFGGVQMVFVGDIFQLPPVVVGDDRETLRRIYGHDCSFFYKAHCLENYSLPKIEFKKIYRQSDPHFIDILDHFRNGKVSRRELMEINSHVVPLCRKENDYRITLTSFKKDAKAINDSKLLSLEGELFTYEAQYEGNCGRLKDMVEDELELKQGAQVMFLKNDSQKRWANGTIARVCRLDSESIFVNLENSDEEIKVDREAWEALDYEYDEEKKRCEKQVVGKVIQYPLRLAWAITIHKSQSQTFNKVAIDFGRGAFSCGQAYVALSRVRSLSGLQLVRPMDMSSVRVSNEVLMFASTFNDETLISTELSVGEAVNDFERNGDYDGAAVKLFQMCVSEAQRGNVLYAYDLLNRSLSYLADDSCLFGQRWSPIENENRESIILNAAGHLYSGRHDEAITLLASVVKANDDNFNGMYLLARALEIKEDWDTVGTFYNQMMAVVQETTGNGLDSTSFRKFKYRLAILNEYHYGKSGAGIINGLITENPYYDRYHLDLRGMLRNHADEIGYEADDNNPLMNALFDDAISDDEFIRKISAERQKKSIAWGLYRLYVSRINLCHMADENLSSEIDSEMK